MKSKLFSLALAAGSALLTATLTYAGCNCGPQLVAQADQKRVQPAAQPAPTKAAQTFRVKHGFVNDVNSDDEVHTFVGLSSRQSNKMPVVLKFHATWCGACQHMSPHDKSLSAEFKRRVGFGAVDASKNQELAGKYGVTALPTYVTFEDGKEVERLVGADPKALKDLLERYSKNAASAKAAPAKGASVKPAPALAKSAPARVAPAA